MNKDERSSHVNMKAPHVEEKVRIDCLVSREVKQMWEEITEADRTVSLGRYFPAHTMERMIRAEYQVFKAFGLRGREARK
ncbi:hypothetical protein [Enterococcus faecium]|uniref:Uncharacterized protein n=1 Tax=Enterococcus faecium TaxID=1352 RepID=A0A9X3XU98_ENTFC|nr:hypothetical protein [Enterococcus faecium]MDC4249081.1 hypothetical protein [Enterococcus faecium]